MCSFFILSDLWFAEVTLEGDPVVDRPTGIRYVSRVRGGQGRGPALVSVAGRDSLGALLLWVGVSVPSGCWPFDDSSAVGTFDLFCAVVDIFLDA